MFFSFQRLKLDSIGKNDSTRSYHCVTFDLVSLYNLMEAHGILWRKMGKEARVIRVAFKIRLFLPAFLFFNSSASLRALLCSCSLRLAFSPTALLNFEQKLLRDLKQSSILKDFGSSQKNSASSFRKVERLSIPSFIRDTCPDANCKNVKKSR